MHQDLHLKKVIVFVVPNFNAMGDAKVVVYKTYMRPFEAYIVKGLLDANGIECFLSNEIFASRNPVYSSNVNGLKLNVFEKDIAKINELLNSMNISLDDIQDTSG